MAQGWAALRHSELPWHVVRFARGEIDKQEFAERKTLLPIKFPLIDLGQEVSRTQC